MKKYLTYIIIFCSFPLSVSAQKIVLSGLISNPALQQQQQYLNKAPRKIPAKDTTLQLPFYDDFSQSGIYPSADKWINKQAFINTSFPLYAPTVGVATLDALDESGAVYRHASSFASFSADTLTSAKIRLDSSFSPVLRSLYIYDSIYFSFYYQPGGGYGSNTWDSTIRGSHPQKGDSLILEFFSSKDSSWSRQWSTGGLSLGEFCPECIVDSIAIKDKQFFKKITIPIVDSARFFRNDFQFRFRNLASIDPQWKSSNSQWHVDYIVLDKYRRFSDTTEDIAFVNPAVSFLQKFQAIRYKQFINSDIKTNTPILIRNMSEEPYLALYYYEISENNENLVAKNPPAGYINTNIYPFSNFGFYSDPNIFVQPVVYSFPNAFASPVNYNIKHIISMATQPDIDKIRNNDTITFIQSFGSYYAYDDGSAEAGIGIEGNSAMALRFPIRVKDTLTAVDLFFNEELDDANAESNFTLCVWREGSNNLPSNTIYTQEKLTPEYGTAPNQFKRFILSSPLTLEPGNYFIGYTQTDHDKLKIGFDQNNDASAELFYYDISSSTPRWLNVFYYGAVMMRPVFGMAAVTKNIAAIPYQPAIAVYPNPATENVAIECVSTNVNYAEITDITGKILKKYHFSTLSTQQSISLNGFIPGVYLLKILTADNNLIVKKIIKQ